MITFDIIINNMDKLDRKDLIESIFIPKEAALLRNIIKDRKFKLAAFVFCFLLFACMVLLLWQYSSKTLLFIGLLKSTHSNYHYGMTVNSILQKQDFFSASFARGALLTTAILVFLWIVAYFLNRKKKIAQNTRIIALNSKIRDMENIISELTGQLNYKNIEAGKIQILEENLKLKSEELLAAIKDAEKQNNQYIRLKALFEDLTNRYNEVLVQNGFKDKKIDQLEKLFDKTKEKMTLTVSELENRLALKDKELKDVRSKTIKSSGFSFFNIFKDKGE